MAPTGHIFQAEGEGVEPSGVTLARFSRPLADQPAPPSKAVPPGFEPRPEGSEPSVLPLHQGTLAHLVGVEPTSHGFGDQRAAAAQAHGSIRIRTGSVQLMRLACYRYTIEQSPTPGSNRRDQFGRLTCYHYISEAKSGWEESNLHHLLPRQALYRFTTSRGRRGLQLRRCRTS